MNPYYNQVLGAMGCASALQLSKVLGISHQAVQKWRRGFIPETWALRLWRESNGTIDPVETLQEAEKGRKRVVEAKDAKARAMLEKLNIV